MKLLFTDAQQVDCMPYKHVVKFNFHDIDSGMTGHYLVFATATTHLDSERSTSPEIQHTVMLSMFDGLIRYLEQTYKLIRQIPDSGFEIGPGSGLYYFPDRQLSWKGFELTLV